MSAFEIFVAGIITGIFAGPILSVGLSLWHGIWLSPSDDDSEEDGHSD